MKVSRTLVISTVVVVLLSILIGVGLAAFISSEPNHKVLFKNCQPDTVKYDNVEGSKYCLYVTKRSGIIRSDYEIAISRDFDKAFPDYGHVVAYPYVDAELMSAKNPSFSASSVDWRGEGVYFETRSKHKVFIPKELFVGGR